MTDSLLAFPRFRNWKARRRWVKAREDMIARAESEGWTTSEISKALRDLKSIYDKERSPDGAA